MYIFGILVLFVVGCNGLPTYLDDWENRIDGDMDRLDLSHLGPEAFGEPSNKTGEFLSFLQTKERTL